MGKPLGRLRQDSEDNINLFHATNTISHFLALLVWIHLVLERAIKG
jgi:hypothetical protein